MAEQAQELAAEVLVVREPGVAAAPVAEPVAQTRVVVGTDIR